MVFLQELQAGPRPLPKDHSVKGESIYSPPVRGYHQQTNISSFENRVRGTHRLTGPFIVRPVDGERASFTAEFGYQNRSVSSGEDYLLPHQFHSINLGLNPRYALDEKWSLNGMLLPGFFSTFDHADVGFRMPILLSAVYANSTTGGPPRWVWVFSLIARVNGNSFFHFPVFPGIGFIFRPDPKWAFEFLGPKFSIVHQFIPPLKFNLSAEYMANDYEVEQGKFGAKSLVFRELKIWAGAEAFLNSWLKINIGAGGGLFRKVKFYESTRSILRIKPGPEARLGLSFDW